VAAIEKFLQFQDAVPCKIRAKRGCATHPRSIAERVSRPRPALLLAFEFPSGVYLPLSNWWICC
jgi:hypothetical protein